MPLERFEFEPEAFVLGELSDEQMARAAALEASDPTFAEAVQKSRLLIQQLEVGGEEMWAVQAPALSFDPALIPQLPKGSVEVGTDPATLATSNGHVKSSPQPSSGKARSGRSRGRGLLGMRPTLQIRPVFAGLALACALVLGGLIGSGLTSTSSKNAPIASPFAGAPGVTLASFGDGPSRASAKVQMVTGSNGKMKLQVAGLLPSKKGEYYELWLLRDAKDMVGVGTFRVGPTGKATIAFPLGVDPERFSIVDVSVQKVSAGPAHSGRSVLRSEPISPA